MRKLLLVLAFVLSGLAELSGQPVQTQAAGAVVSFHLERPGLEIPVYTFTVHEDGTGTYVAKVKPVSGNPYSMTVAADSEVTQPLALTPEATARLFEKVRSTDHFRAPCASKAKNIADTGAKTLSYRGPDGEASCSYNFSENKTVVGLTDTFQAMAFTLDAARRLEAKHRFDRLGLDSEMITLVNGVKDGRAQGLSNIASTLHALVDDPQVLERVRTQAAKLLEQSTVVP